MSKRGFMQNNSYETVFPYRFNSMQIKFIFIWSVFHADTSEIGNGLLSFTIYYIFIIYHLFILLFVVRLSPGPPTSRHAVYLNGLKLFFLQFKHVNYLWLERSRNETKGKVRCFSTSPRNVTEQQDSSACNRRMCVQFVIRTLRIYR